MDISNNKPLLKQSKTNRTINLDEIFSEVLVTAFNGDYDIHRPSLDSRKYLAAEMSFGADAAKLVMFTFGGWDSKNFGRVVTDGPLTPGPYMYAHELPRVSSDSNFETVIVNDGDVLIFMGEHFHVTKEPSNLFLNNKLLLELVK